MTLESLRGGRVREPERLASFILGTCRYVARDLRRGGRRRQALLDRYLAVEATAEPSLPPPARLSDCLQRLAERDRSVLVMTFYAERSADEIAGELGLAAGNVRVVRHRALGRLRECLEARA
jgi:RNA polymerase sigma-70 factor (ECF subfamily)